MKFPFFIINAVLLLILLNSIPADAQKRQKDIQDNSLFVSAPIKIDARLNEWQDTLQAFNRTAMLGYTIANDKKNLYLVIKSSDAMNNAKILSGGISFAVNTEGKKKDKEAFVITFPVINAVARSASQRQSSRGGQFQRRSSETDAAMLERRKALVAQFKEIKVSGFKGITDSLISIYNEYGIKAAVDYDAKSSFVYELAIPLNLLDLLPDSKNELAYNIKINGRSFWGGRGMSNGNQERGGSGGFDGRDSRRGGTGYGGSQPMGNAIVTSFGEPVDFWGKYSLATQ